MSELKFTMSMSLDGYVAGPNQSLENPIGEGGMAMHEWMFGTRTFREMQGEGGGSVGVDNEQASSWNENVGATIMGRNMFGPIRGPWPDEEWKGWWGDDPPYGTPVFVLTHHPREPIEMQGGTTFHFVTDGMEVALDRAREVAGDRDVAIGGGASTIQQYLRAGLVDQMRLHVVPVLLGTGERLFDDLDGALAGFECVELVSSPAAAHFVLRRKART
jgi:dihydrofolate reductase